MTVTLTPLVSLVIDASHTPGQGWAQQVFFVLVRMTPRDQDATGDQPLAGLHASAERPQGNLQRLSWSAQRTEGQGDQQSTTARLAPRWNTEGPSVFTASAAAAKNFYTVVPHKSHGPGTSTGLRLFSSFAPLTNRSTITQASPSLPHTD